jgi:hypothetical protein
MRLWQDHILHWQRCHENGIPKKRKEMKKPMKKAAKPAKKKKAVKKSSKMSY